MITLFFQSSRVFIIFIIRKVNSSFPNKTFILLNIQNETEQFRENKLFASMVSSYWTKRRICSQRTFVLFSSIFFYPFSYCSTQETVFLHGAARVSILLIIIQTQKIEFHA